MVECCGFLCKISFKGFNVNNKYMLMWPCIVWRIIYDKEMSKKVSYLAWPNLTYLNLIQPKVLRDVTSQVPRDKRFKPNIHANEAITMVIVPII